MIYLFSEPAGSTYRLSAVRDAHGNTTRLGYREGRIESITDAAGRVVRVDRRTSPRCPPRRRRSLTHDLRNDDVPAPTPRPRARRALLPLRLG
ncbi:hypothetical protein AB3663_25525 [Sorangium cellulosum]